MATLCGMSNSCDDDQVVSIKAIIGILIGCLIVLIVIAAIISIICILCKKKRQPRVWVQSPVSGYHPSMNMSYYSTYNQSSRSYEPPPPYQQENVPVVSDGKIGT